jgi:hypothetical protein
MSEAAKRLVELGESYAAREGERESYAAREALRPPASDAGSDPATPGASAADSCSFPPTPAAVGDGPPPPPSPSQPFPPANQRPLSPLVATIVQVGL